MAHRQAFLRKAALPDQAFDSGCAMSWRELWNTLKMPNAEAFERALCRELDKTKAREIVQKARERHNDLYAERK